MTKQIRTVTLTRSIRVAIAGLVSTFGVLAGTVALAGGPAAATTPIFVPQPMPAAVHAVAETGSVGDFSYSPSDQQMGRNIDVDVSAFKPGSTVSITWSDVSKPAVSLPALPPVTAVINYSDPSDSDTSFTITNVPRVTCGDTLEIEATGLTGYYDQSGAPQYLLQTWSVSPMVRYTEDCGPEVWLTDDNAALAGDGFTTGGQVLVTETAPIGLPPHQVLQPVNVTTAATTQAVTLHCSGLQHQCFSLLQPGGQIDVALPQTLSCDVGSVSALDESTDQRAGTTAACILQ
jgi:hypothetical protein